MINTQILGQRIAESRRKIGITQNALAERVGVTAQAVSKWEQGRSCPDIAILDEVADALGISLFELLGMDERQKSGS
jgi:transcriptional regulator with XRE-family HTH domain